MVKALFFCDKAFPNFFQSFLFIRVRKIIKNYIKKLPKKQFKSDPELNVEVHQRNLIIEY